jgi:outer membrane protein assembly factor BamB
MSLAISAADWAQWRGPNRDGHAGAGEKLPDKLPADFSPLWKVPSGGGFSSPVIAGERLVYMGGDGSEEIAHCLDAKTGKELWKQPIAPQYTDEWGFGTRATPIIDGSRAYVTSCNGEFRCLDLDSGKVVWGTSFEKDFGVKFLGSKAKEGTASRRGNNGSPVIDGKVIFVPVGAVGNSIVAFDKENGNVLWKSGDDEAAYSSLMVEDLAGVRQVIAFNADALAGFRRGDGKLLWRIPLVTNAKRHACTPVIFGDNIVVASHTLGMISYLISKNGEEVSAKEAWRNKDMKINLATPVLVGGFLYSHGPSKNYVCVDASNGQTKWTQGGFGEQVSHTVVFGEKLAVLSDSGELIVIKANPEKYQELGRAQVCGKTWVYPAAANGKLFIRDTRELACYPIAGSSR